MDTVERCGRKDQAHNSPMVADAFLSSTEEPAFAGEKRSRRYAHQIALLERWNKTIDILPSPYDCPQFPNTMEIADWMLQRWLSQTHIESEKGMRFLYCKRGERQ
jgi:hypothetical protein